MATMIQFLGSHYRELISFFTHFLCFADRQDEIAQNGFLLPDDEIKRLLVGVAETKALPSASVEGDLHAHGLEYARTLNEPSKRLDEAQVIRIRDIPLVVNVGGRRAELQRQAEMILKKYTKTENTVG